MTTNNQNGNKIRVIVTEGTPFERGFAHGKACKDDIRRYAEERIHLARQKTWSGHDLTRDEVLSYAEKCLPDHEAYAPDLMEEWRGMAEATGLSLAELVVVGGFTDFVDVLYNNVIPPTKESVTPIDDCTCFLVSDSTAGDGLGFLVRRGTCMLRHYPLSISSISKRAPINPRLWSLPRRAA